MLVNKDEVACGGVGAQDTLLTPSARYRVRRAATSPELNRARDRSAHLQMRPACATVRFGQREVLVLHIAVAVGRAGDQRHGLAGRVRKRATPADPRVLTR